MSMSLWLFNMTFITYLYTGVYIYKFNLLTDVMNKQCYMNSW